MIEGNILANKSAKDRSESDFYATPENATIALLNYLQIPTNSTIWEPACGNGNISEILIKYGFKVYSTDLYNRGYGKSGIDFLTAQNINCDFIITNPPFSISKQFIEKCISLQTPFALLLKSQYWHAEGRRELFFKHTPKAILPLTWRPDFLYGKKGGAPTMKCLWTVWGIGPSEKTEYIPLQRPK